MAHRASVVLVACAIAAVAGAQTSPVVPVTPDIPTDSYSAGRALVADLGRIVTPKGVQEKIGRAHV